MVELLSGLRKQWYGLGFSANLLVTNSSGQMTQLHLILQIARLPHTMSPLLQQTLRLVRGVRGRGVRGRGMRSER